MKKFKQNFYNQINWIPIFSLIFGNLINFLNFSQYSILISLTIFLIFCFQKVNFKSKLIAISLSIFTIIFSFFNQSSKINLVQHFETLINFSLHEKIINFIKINHESMSSDFIFLVIFNIRENQGLNFYNQLNQLSIGHLVVVSGFHFNVLYWLIQKSLFKVPRLKGFIFLFLVLILIYFQKFNYSIIISVLMQVLTFSKIKLLNYSQRLCLASSIIFLFYPHALKSYSFQLSFLARIAIAMVLFLKIKNKFFKSIITTLLINILIWPVIGNFNNRFSLWTFLLSIIYSWLFIFNFIFCFFCFPLYWISPLFSKIFLSQIIIFNFFSSINITLKIIGFNLIEVYFYNFIFISMFCLFFKLKNLKQSKIYSKFNNNFF